MSRIIGNTKKLSGYIKEAVLGGSALGAVAGAAPPTSAVGTLVITTGTITTTTAAGGATVTTVVTTTTVGATASTVGAAAAVGAAGALIGVGLGQCVGWLESWFYNPHLAFEVVNEPPRLEPISDEEALVILHDLLDLAYKEGIPFTDEMTLSKLSAVNQEFVNSATTFLFKGIKAYADGARGVAAAKLGLSDRFLYLALACQCDVQELIVSINSLADALDANPQLSFLFPEYSLAQCAKSLSGDWSSTEHSILNLEARVLRIILERIGLRYPDDFIAGLAAWMSDSRLTTEFEAFMAKPNQTLSLAELLRDSIESYWGYIDFAQSALVRSIVYRPASAWMPPGNSKL